ncbi:DoxX family protein [Paludibaculum fermentans]|uniref:DoxX family protein n=1 Tax=Paludibaculum fermentans TaxID=1473598 RepID=A0A7S7SKB3_PALFE|nr:DoxX family protein [Paludibaculum fermentans]QOY88119.1 DoxX family protein [Paludibaculum fermentans]
MGLISFSSYRSDRLLDAGLLALRLGAGFSLFWLHGWSKLAAASGYVFQGQEWGFVAGVAGLGFPLPGVFAVAAALAESIGSLLVAVGLLTRVSAGFVGFTMLVAIYRHLSAGQSAELASLYLLAAIAIGLAAAGRYSLDAVLARGTGRAPAGELEATV